MAFQRAQELFEIVGPVAPDKMSVRIAVDKMHMDDIFAQNVKPLVDSLSGNAHCRRVDHCFEIRMVYFVQHPFYILHGCRQIGFLRPQRFHRQTYTALFRVFREHGQHLS